MSVPCTQCLRIIVTCIILISINDIPSSQEFWILWQRGPTSKAQMVPLDVDIHYPWTQVS